MKVAYIEVSAMSEAAIAAVDELFDRIPELAALNGWRAGDAAKEEPRRIIAAAIALHSSDDDFEPWRDPAPSTGGADGA